MKKSLQGRAHRTIKRLKPDASLTEVIERMEHKFGHLLKGRKLMKEFYSAQQVETEDVTSWAGRLEDILDQARTIGKVTESEIDDLLREQFWSGLRDDIQDGTRHLLDSFDELELSIREIEEERKQKNPKKRTTRITSVAKMSQHDGNKSEMQSLKSVVEELVKEVKALKETNKMGKSTTETTEVHNKGTGVRRISCWN